MILIQTITRPSTNQIQIGHTQLISNPLIVIYFMSFSANFGVHAKITLWFCRCEYHSDDYVAFCVLDLLFKKKEFNCTMILNLLAIFALILKDNDKNTQTKDHTFTCISFFNLSIDIN